uniref:RING-type domain-containing protein n=1 Tax=Globodera rostochiensis TaxID=31243 RepID=A0A914I0Q4_GLORO
MLQQVNSGIKGKMKTMLRKAKNKIKLKKHKFFDSRDQFSEESGSDYFHDCPESENESMEDNLLKCKVCWDGVPLEQLCFCDRSMRVKSEGNSGEEDNANANANANANKSGEIHEETTHAFCSQCLEQYTNTAHQEMPFAKGGLGLRCMVPKCNNPITWQEIRAFVPSKVTRSLEDRCAELIVSQSKLSYLERCRKCNCAVEMGISPEEQLIFCCPECASKFCRKCNEAWVDEHNGISCEQFATKQKRQHNLDERLTAVAVHKCHKCKSSFIKRSGCNRVTCKCGASVCSICWTTNVSYEHFCECFLPPSLLGRCKNCGKCLLWHNAKENEEREMERIRKESDAGDGASASQQI